MNKKRKIIFERISIFHYPILLYFLWRGYTIMVFNFSSYSSKYYGKFIRSFILKKRITEILIKSLSEHGNAIDEMAEIYKNLPENMLRRKLEFLYKDPQVDLLFNKFHLIEIYKCLCIHNFLKKCFKNGEDIFFIPENYFNTRKLIQKFGRYDISEINSIEIPSGILPAMFVVRFFHRLKWFTIGVLLLYVRFQRNSKETEEQNKHRSFKYAVSIASAHFFKFRGKRGFDFLLDNKNITAENTVFILPFQLGNFSDHLKNEGFNFIILPKILSKKGILDTQKQCSELFINQKIFYSLLSGLWSPSFYLEVFVQSCIFYVYFKSQFKSVSFKNYIYSNQEGWTQIANNIIIKNAGGCTWNYSSFIGGGLLNSKDGDYSKTRNVLWAFQNPDHFLAVNQEVNKYYKLHHQETGQYHVIGSIYSQMVREYKNELNIEDEIKKNFKNSVTGHAKIIAFFDTSYVNDESALTSFEDAIAVYSDMERLLNEDKNILMIFKPSKDKTFFIDKNREWSCPEKGLKMVEIWDRLISNERVYWADHTGNLPKIMAISDLTITHCLSSPTTEALGARKKAFWYEPGDKHRGLLYDKIPGLVMHGYKELKERVNFLLFGISDDDYNKYLDENILGKIEYKLDGRGLDRLRDALRG